jgi:hypothetical protein
MPGEHVRMLEIDFLSLLDRVLPTILGAQIIREPRLEHAHPDFLALWPDTGKEAIIEAKIVTPNTRTRLRDIVQQLTHYADAYAKVYPDKPPPELALAVPGAFSAQHIGYLYESGIRRIIDGAVIRAAAGDDALAGFMAESKDSSPPSLRSTTESLLDRLMQIPPGRADWSAYQSLCGEILSFLLCPPLSQPISESANRSRINRRDFILPNYATSGYWDYMRSYYQAHYVVVDAKNYVGNVKKKEILQMANYLTAHGAGQFGIIVSRTGGDRSAELTRREQWILHQKMIVVLNDDDMRQMVSLRVGDIDPAELIRQKIEDFRLGF